MDGQSIAHYEVTEKLGVGGMGEVYRARDTKLGRAVAIKILPDGMATNAQVLSRFEREAKILASLNHPNIAMVFGIEDVDGSKAIVMELVEGDTLGERLQKGAMSVEECLPVFRQIASALEAAHEKGIIHRDLKPGNIKFTADGQVKVLDFGLAKPTVEADEIDTEANTLMAETTMPGTVLGTPAYMSPEQTRGEAVDKRTDVWAFGCCLYECLTGCKPFNGGTISDMMAEVLKSDPDFTIVPTETPNDILSLLRRCLEKEPRRRLRDIGDIAIRLEETTETSRIMTVPVEATEGPAKKPPSSMLLKLVAGLAAVGLGFGLSSIWSPEPVTNSASIKSIAILPFENRNEDGDEGLAEEIADGVWEKLWAIDGLVAKRVRIPLEKYLGDGKSSSDVAAEHKVDALVVGSLREQGGRYFVRARLIRGADGQDMPLGKVEEAVDKPARLENQVALAIAEKIRSDLSNHQRNQILASEDIDPQAFEAFLKGQAAYDKGDFLSALTDFGEALKIESDYVDALVLTGMAVMHSGISQEEPGNPLSSQQSREEARSWLKKAFSLDSGYARTHSNLGVLAMFDGAFGKAHRDLTKARELAPDHPVTNLVQGIYLSNVEARYEDAAEIVDRSLAVDPHREQFRVRRALVDIDLGRSDRAVERLSTLPPSPWGRAFEALALLKLGRLGEAEQRATESVALSNRGPEALGLLARIHIALKNTEEVRALLEEMEQSAEKRDRPQLAIAQVYAALKEWESAFYWLERVIEEMPAHQLISAHGADTIELFGRQARYWELIKQAGFPELPIGHPFRNEEQKVRSLGGQEQGNDLAGPIRSLTILPFDNQKNDPAEDYLSEGISDVLGVALNKIQALTVRQSGKRMRDYRESGKRYTEIAKQLEVTGVIDGSVSQLDGTFEAVAKIYDPGGVLRWTESFEHESFRALRDEIAFAIAEEIKVNVLDAEKASILAERKIDFEAYKAFRKGQALLERYTPEAIAEGLKLLAEARRLDPNYIEPRIWEAPGHWVPTMYGGAMKRPEEAFKRPLEILREVEEIEPNASMVLSFGAWLTMVWEWDWAAASKRFQHALRVNPREVDALRGLTRYRYYVEQRPESALDTLHRAMLYDDRFQLRAELAELYHWQGNYEAGLKQSLANIVEQPNDPGPYIDASVCYRNLGQPAEAIALMKRALENPTLTNPSVLAGFAQAHAAHGEEARARELLSELENHAPGIYVPATAMAGVHASLGDTEQALNWLNKGVDGREGFVMVKIRSHDWMTLLGEEEGYWEVIDRMNFPALPQENAFYEKERRLRPWAGRGQ